MAELRKVVTARSAPAGSSHSGDTERLGGRLSDELQSEQVERIAVFMRVAAAVWSVGLFVDLVVLPLGAGTRNDRTVLIGIAGLAVSLVSYFFVRRPGGHIPGKRDAGVAFTLLTAMLIALINAWGIPPSAGVHLQLSWNAILILVYAMIAPSRPRKMLWTALAAATMDPLAFAIAALAGRPSMTPLAVVVLCWPTYACAAISIIPSRILQRIGRRLHEAQELGSYQLIEPLGHGGMGEVWRAEHRLLARDAAIKLVRPEVLGARTDSERQSALRRFEREAQATAALRSPHSIQLFDFGTTQEGTFYYVMELLTGRDLESLVREFGPVPANRAIYLLRQVAHSLADAHAQGLVHRDIKPANIYVCRMGLEFDFVKVLDFGLVKFKERQAGADTLATIVHTTTGTPAYMAPETILGDVEVDRRADVYALGCVAYYLLTGQLVFEADSSMKMLLQHLNAEPVPPSQRTELPIPRELDELVLACLQKDPNKRPQNAGELFKMATDCRVSDAWDQAHARRWWEVHLPQFSTAPTPAEAFPLARRRAVVPLGALKDR